MDEEKLNIAIRRFLKKVGIASQKIIENNIIKANKDGLIVKGNEIDLEMTLIIKNFQTKNTINEKIILE
ncbi:MAG: hypothetical protein CFH19_01227 [Alphaproteobacteria bacterium MarineAlpha5_Bin9]|nr:MAG: hypothetical protein CFH19_01227 [Alphaproteobacteria bacterium MarineAlpha5_Bin9]|tara:strand:+ start:8721 stop:8927 length:207 start_codon:yes stop_codon:yes gene_type:complete